MSTQHDAPGALGADVSARRPAERAAFETAAHRRGVRATAEYAVFATWYIGVWFWVVALAIGGIILFVMQRTGDVDLTAVSGPSESARFFLFVMGIVLPLSMVALHVAAGGTRRSFAQGMWVSGLVVGLTFGLVSAAVAWIEWWGFDRAGWPVDRVQNQLYQDGSQFGLVLLVQSVSCAVYFLVGIAIALGYYRAGFWRGTGIMLVALVPLAVAEVSLQSGWFGQAFAGSVGVPAATVWGAALGGLVAVALAALLVSRIMADVAVRPVDFGSSVTMG
ncbi:hypothetical protein IF650_08005 [Cellulosimicrobium terreum]|nr:hypothetical protein [Cellulosimicrobium terreum]